MNKSRGQPELLNETQIDEPSPMDVVPANGELPELRGSPAQIKWALTIRANTLELEWPFETRQMLRSIVDSTWWIANKSVVNTMKFKNPSMMQMVPVVRTTSRPISDSVGKALASNAERSRERRADEQRFTDAEQWAESVSQNPKLAKSAILAVLSRLYKDGALKESMRRASRAALAEATGAVDKDVDAINRMLTQ